MVGGGRVLFSESPPLVRKNSDKIPFQTEIFPVLFVVPGWFLGVAFVVVFRVVGFGRFDRGGPGG